MKLTNTHLTTPAATSPVIGALAGLLFLLITVSTSTAFAADNGFTVVSTESSVSISGNVMGSPLNAQGSGSLVTQFSGTLRAEVDGSSIRFPGQSHLVALDSGDWQPLPDGSDGSAPANYGGAGTFQFGDGVAAVRDAEVDVTSETTVLANGQFDMQGLTFHFPTNAPGSLAYRVQGAVDASGAILLNEGSVSGQVAQGSLETAGNQQVLTIPINYDIYFSLLSRNDTTVSVKGQLVATRDL